MRTTMRLVIIMMNAIETALEEISRQFPEVIALLKQMRATRQSACALLDRMIDEGYKEETK